MEDDLSRVLMREFHLLDGLLYGLAHCPTQSATHNQSYPPTTDSVFPNTIRYKTEQLAGLLQILLID